MNLLQRRREMMSNGIPYQRVEYLQGDMHSYIDTGIVPTSDTPFNVTFMYTTTSGPGYGNIFQSRIISGEQEYAVSGYLKFMVSLGSRNRINMPQSLGAVMSVNYDGSQVLVNGELVAVTKGTITANLKSISLFACREINQIVQFSDSRIYHVSFGIGGNLADFHPVRIGDTGYMYDKVSRQLFSNKGTGQFILGPDI